MKSRNDTFFAYIPRLSIDEEDLNQHGFKVITNDKQKLHLVFQEGQEKEIYIIISKERFKHRKEAIKFSETQNLPLSDPAISLFLAMAGVCNEKNSFIHDALVFEFSETPDPNYKSGIWAWSESNEDGAMLLWDGQETDSNVFSVEQIKELFKIEPTLPAICSNFK
ncbi:hypothetical protein ACNVED_04100 [Legionella sp. D16C41]|uniref:hypothetical protein n=1 Tax=Legionella sp. D16C41 TaxID=3402688 RepID=UPI003AF41003